MAKIVQWRRKDEPVCCYEGADFHNIGYTKMILPDGTPIEAELYRYDDNITLSVVMSQFNIRHKNIHSAKNRYGNETIIPFCRDVEGRDYSILDKDMIAVFWEENIDTISEYVEYLADMKVIRWSGDLRNGAVQYLFDLEGNSIACIKVTVEENGQRFCEVLPEFQSFEGNERL